MSVNHLLVACTPPACVLLFPIARTVSCGVNRLRSVSMTTVHERLTPTPVHVPPAADGMRLRATERARYNDYEYVLRASVQ